MTAAGADPAQTFRDEAADLLVELEEALLVLEERPDDREVLDTAFRALHTIKGSGAMFGFDEVAAFTHHLENAFDQVRKGQLAAGSELIGVALAARDHIRALIEAPERADPQAGPALLARLAQVVGGSGPKAVATAPCAPKPPADEPASWRVRFRLPADCLVRGTNPLLLLDELRGLGSHCTVAALTESVPPLSELDPTACHVTWDVVVTCAGGRAAIEEVFIFVIDDMELDIQPLPSVPPRVGDILVARGDVAPETVAAAVSRQERLGEMLVRTGEVSEDRLNSALAEQRHLRGEAEAAKGGQGGASNTVKVPAERLDDLMDQVGELVIAQARLKQLIAGSDDPLVKSIAEEIERLANSLRDTTMGIRMVPIGSLFGRFRRLVRDLSRELGKEVVLTTEGEETELDKTVIERLADPLVHLIRNSIDHGLEAPDERERRGKPAQGTIHLSARHAGAQVLISVGDDGRGMDVARIRAKAEEQGLLAPGAELADGDILQLILSPGFSTAAKVTNVSGRGVGMDVVKRTIDNLRGSIDMATRPGQGSSVTLQLPLTLAIIDGLLVRVGRGRYVIPLAAVEECVELSAAEAARSTGRSFLSIRGDLVPFLRLRELFTVATPAEPYQKVVIVSSGDLRVGLVVDQIIGDHQTVIKSLSKLHADVESFSGATILGDGTVALILDVAHLIELGQAREQRLQAS
ncbi:MAG: chemotaxis protein CheA [Solirubrobacterales bacterium]